MVDEAECAVLRHIHAYRVNQKLFRNVREVFITDVRPASQSGVGS